MPDDKVVKPPEAPTPPGQPAAPAVPAATPPAAGVTPPAGTPAAPVDDGKGEFVPRTRLNEVLQKQHEAEERAKIAEERLAAPPVSPVPPANQIDQMAEQISLESGFDEFGNRLVSPAHAKASILISARLGAAATSGLRMKQNIDSFIRVNPKAAPYAVQIETELSKLEPGVKDNPENVARKYREIVGDPTNIEKIEKEAFERGKQVALENKRIVSGAIGETPSAEIPAGKTAEEMLTADQREYAAKYKIPYATYYERLHSRRV